MTSPLQSRAAQAAGPQVEAFAGTTGRWLGWFGVALGALMVVGEPLTSSDVSWTVVLLGVAIACLSWVTMVRPKAAAHGRGLLLRNMVRDIEIPWPRIERCAVNQTLQIVTDTDSFHGLGVSRSARAIMREDYGRTSMMTGLGSRLISRTPASTGASVRQEVQGGRYTSYVESRITDLATRGDRKDPAQPVVAWAPVPTALLAVAAVCLVLAFV